MNAITTTLAYKLQAPSVPMPRGEPPPLLVLVHGYGSNEDDLLGLAPYFDGRFYLVSPRAPLTLGPGAYSWYQFLTVSEPDPRSFREGLDHLSTFIDTAVASLGVDARRVYALGFSQGAVMSLATLLTRPDQVRGVVAMSGYVSITSGLTVRTADLAGRAALVVHGTEDPLIPVEYGRQARDYLAQTPVALTYREYPIGHHVSDESMRDIDAWLRSQLEAASGGNAT